MNLLFDFNNPWTSQRTSSLHDFKYIISIDYLSAIDDFMKTPTIVAIMNFIIWGSGYLYLRKAWGFWVVLIDYIILSSIASSPELVYNLPLNLVFIIISLLFAWHGYEMAKKELIKKKKWFTAWFSFPLPASLPWKSHLL